LLPHQPVPRIGLEVLLWSVMLVYAVWDVGWRKFLREVLPCMVIGPAGVEADAKFTGLFGGIGGSLLLLLTVVVAVLLWDFFMRLIGVGADVDGSIAPSWSAVWATARAKRLSRAQIRAVARVPTIKTVSVKASELAGTVEYDTMRLSGIHVEELAADWVQQLSETKTDENGHFELPAEGSVPVHWVRVSWPAVETVHLRWNSLPTPSRYWSV
jgi:hypothetical protein